PGGGNPAIPRGLTRSDTIFCSFLHAFFCYFLPVNPRIRSSGEKAQRKRLERWHGDGRSCEGTPVARRSLSSSGPMPTASPEETFRAVHGHRVGGKGPGVSSGRP